jgi:hypothetical protein
LLWAKGRQHCNHALAVQHNHTVCEWDWMRVALHKVGRHSPS